MTLDSRSRERLEALGRRLPRPLPAPESSAAHSAPAAAPGSGRHRLETENDPQQLFRELMAASTDGTVPPHLIERLRSLENQNRVAEPVAAAEPRRPLDERASRRRGSARTTTARGLSPEEQQLYATFAHLLLEDEEQG
jgi:hypothetical protein